MGEAGKRIAAREAAHIILNKFRDARVIGVGTGSTVRRTLEYIAELEPEFFQGKLFIATSIDTLQALKRYGARATTELSMQPEVYFDGADELVLQPGCPCIKGRGAALYAEKLAAYYSMYSIVVVDESKLSTKLGSLGKPVPIEVDPKAVIAVMNMLEKLGLEPRLRMAGGKDGPVISDTGGVILDVRMNGFDPVEFETLVELIPGVKAVGVFIGMFNMAVVGFDDGRVVVREC